VVCDSVPDPAGSSPSFRPLHRENVVDRSFESHETADVLDRSAEVTLAVKPTDSFLRQYRNLILATAMFNLSS